MSIITNDRVSLVDTEIIENELIIECEFEIGDGGRLPNYDGSYVITPEVFAQTLPTERKSTIHDIEVLAIPTDEVSNLYGTTFSIAR